MRPSPEGRALLVGLSAWNIMLGAIDAALLVLYLPNPTAAGWAAFGVAATGLLALVVALTTRVRAELLEDRCPEVPGGTP